MIKKIIATVAVVLLVVIVAQWGFSQMGWRQSEDETGPGCRRFGRAARVNVARWIVLADELELTDQQRSEIKQIMLEHRDDLAPVVKDLTGAKRALCDAVLSDNPSERQIRKAASDLSTAIGDAAVIAAEIAAEARTVLTTDQIELLKDFAAKQEKHVDKHIEKMFD